MLRQKLRRYRFFCSLYGVLVTYANRSDHDFLTPYTLNNTRSVHMQCAEQMDWAAAALAEQLLVQ